MPQMTDLVNQYRAAAAKSALALDTGKFGDEGKYVTLESGKVIFITDHSGFVPERMRAGDHEAKRFSRSALERALIDHHEQMGGGHTAHAEHQLNSFVNPFKFRGVAGKDGKQRLPEEIANHIGPGSPLRSLVTLAKPSETAQGEDAMAHLGLDRYLDIAHGKATGKLTGAKAMAEASDDPEVRFLAHIHSNLPEETRAGLRQRATKLRQKAAHAPAGRAREAVLAQAVEHERRADAADHQGLVAVKPGTLRVGTRFTVHGQHFRVAEDEHGYRVLQHGVDYQESTPLDALRSVPVDQGSLKAMGRRREPKYTPAHDEVAPFGGGEPVDHRAVVLSDGRTLQVAMQTKRSLPKR